uniref:Alanyl-tRNA synthetase domain containing 1 n=1 Tax=Scleropages formosus TaxID=113540 RepID=A0A8D0CD33_SCLFO
MAFQCQRDSYVQEFVTTVVSCSPCELSLERASGKKEKVKGFEVILKDTVLFPEGGGQPDDRGTLGGVPVLRVTRRGAEAVHFVASAVEVGSSIQLKVDWDRRFDHMQQHSGQHLITALADSTFGYKTTSWELGRQYSTIELNTAMVKAGEVEALENAVNDKIRAAVPITIELLFLDDPAVQQVRSRGLPDDHSGPIRIVNIEGMDSNMCCGTHVSNLSHLQVQSIVHCCNMVHDTAIRQGRSLSAKFYFLVKVGRDHLSQAINLTYQSCLINLFPLKSNLNLLRDMAVLIAQNFKSDPNRGNLFCLHRKDGDAEFMNIIAKEIGTEDTILFLTVGEERGAGLFLLAGPVDVVDRLGPRVAELLEGKGAGKKGRFQGKTSCMGRRAGVKALLQEHSQNLRL